MPRRAQKALRVLNAVMIKKTPEMTVTKFRVNKASRRGFGYWQARDYI